MIRDTSAQDRIVTAPTGSRPQRRRWLLAGAALLALLLAGSVLSGWMAGERSADAARLRFATVERGTLVRDAAVNGRVVAAISPTLHAPVAGTVSLRIAAGDTVRQGQVLAEIDSPELANTLQRERSTLAELDATLGRARITADQQRLTARRESDEAGIALTAAERDLQRIERAFSLGALPEIDVLRARDTLESARIRARNARSAAELAGRSAGFDLQSTAQQVERQRLVVADLERRVDELQIRAPVDGLVGTLSVAERAAVIANAPLMTVVDLSRLEVELEVPEAYADDLGLGMTAELRVGTASVTGRISAVSPEVVGSQVLARVRFDGGQPPGLRQNQRLQARVLFEEKSDVLRVARGPFLEALGGRHAYVLRDGVAERVAIETGATSVSAIEIVSGLAAGDRIVIAGTDTFHDAERVVVND